MHITEKIEINERRNSIVSSSRLDFKIRNALESGRCIH